MLTILLGIAALGLLASQAKKSPKPVPTERPPTSPEALANGSEVVLDGSEVAAVPLGTGDETTNVSYWFSNGWPLAAQIVRDLYAEGNAGVQPTAVQVESILVKVHAMNGDAFGTFTVPQMQQAILPYVPNQGTITSVKLEDKAEALSSGAEVIYNGAADRPAPVFPRPPLRPFGH